MKKNNSIKRGGAFALAETLFNTVRKAFLMVICFLALMVALTQSAHAGLQIQLSTNTCAVNTTNTIKLPGDVTGIYTNGEIITAPNTVINSSQTTQLPLLVGGYFANTAAGSSNIVFGVWETTDGSLWTSSTNISVAVPATSTNWYYTPVNLHPSIGVKAMYGLRFVANTNTAGVTGTNIFLKGFPKTGI